MSVVSNNSDGRAVLESPVYNRSAQGYGLCLQFRFLMFGAGAATLEIYQDLNGTESRIWKHSNNTVPHWIDGQVSFTSVTKSKVSSVRATLSIALYKMSFTHFFFIECIMVNLASPPIQGERGTKAYTRHTPS